MQTQKVNYDSRFFNRLLFYLLVFENLEYSGLPMEARVGSEIFLSSNNII